MKTFIYQHKNDKSGNIWFCGLVGEKAPNWSINHCLDDEWNTPTNEYGIVECKLNVDYKKLYEDLCMENMELRLKYESLKTFLLKE